MIVSLGIPSEPPLRLLAEACVRKSLPHVILDQRRQADWSVELDLRQPAASRIGDGRVAPELTACSGIYLRTMDPARVPGWDVLPDTAALQAMFGRLWQLLDDAALPGRVVNRPMKQMSNGSKPYQSLVIRQHGFDIPETCVSSDIDTVREFIAACPAVVYKSISGTRSIVRRVDADAMTRLEKVRWCPVQFQECIVGFNVRVHVVGERTFATRIDSDTVDYRYATQDGGSSEFSAWRLAPEVEARCIALAGALELPFAGIDLMFADDGRTVCFEVNPSPGYSVYERRTGQPISDALADFLSGN